MRKWLWLIAPLLIIALASLAIACGNDNKGGTPTTGKTPTAETTAKESPAAGATKLVATVAEFGGSGASGTATLTQTGTGTEVEVEMEGLPEGPHANHIHHGTCAAQGEIHVGLTELQAGADGSANASTTITDPAFDHWLAREHYVAVHAGGGDVIACGEVVPAP